MNVFYIITLWIMAIFCVGFLSNIFDGKHFAIRVIIAYPIFYTALNLSILLLKQKS